jgi:DNA-binding winged helix-turn-helix (wHTH) protein
VNFAMNEGYAETPLLVATAGDLHGSRWAMSSDSLLIGRAPDCDIVAADRQVSRHHARITRTADGFSLQDLQSKNGTHVNGKKVTEPILLQDGDEIQIALALKLVFVGSEATVPLTEPGSLRAAPGRLVLDPLARKLWIYGQELDPPLSSAQFELLRLLYENSGEVVGREEIVERVWPEVERVGITEQAIDALARRLRERLDELDPGTPYVVTVRGIGFRLDNPPSVD